MGEEITFPEGQFGRKVGKHAASFGLDPSDADHRDRMRRLIERIASSPDEVATGSFRGQGEVRFFIKGQDVVVATLCNEFVTILKGGAGNPSVRRAVSDG